MRLDPAAAAESKATPFGSAVRPYGDDLWCGDAQESSYMNGSLQRTPDGLTEFTIQTYVAVDGAPLEVMHDLEVLLAEVAAAFPWLYFEYLVGPAGDGEDPDQPDRCGD